MLAELVLDVADLKLWLVVGLFAISFFTLVWPFLKGLPDKISKAGDWFSFVDAGSNEPVPTDPNGTGSDKPAPVGINEYLNMIKETAPNADYAVWWDYAERGMTQAQVAIEEAKLARKGDSA